MSKPTEKANPVHRHQCGTINGYVLHHKHGENPCDDCREAKRIKSRQDYAAKRQKLTTIDGEKPAKRGRKPKQKKPQPATFADLSDKTADGYPKGLRKGGKQLWDDIHASFQLTPVVEVLVLELCRNKDRLDRISGALASKDALWFELDEGRELDNGDLQIKIVVNSMITEARQLGTAMSQMMSKLGVLQPAKQEAEKNDPLAALANRRLRSVK